MKPYWTDKVLALGLVMVLAIAIGCSGVGAQPPDPQQKDSALPFSNEGFELSKGTPVFVRLQSSISSSTAETGQSFSALLDEPIMANGRMVAPEGATVSGRIVASRKSGHLLDAGYLRITLSSLTVNGKEIPIQTSSVFVEGGSLNKRNVVYSGAGTGGSALLSALAAEGGTTAAYADGKKEVGFAAQHRIGFRLMAQVKSAGD